MLLRDASLVVVDTETTGSKAAEDRVIEIGAARVLGGRVVETYQQLINPDCAVPSRITRLTGISNAMVFDQPHAKDVLPAFREFLGDGVLVAHNLSFDLRFLNAEYERAGFGTVTNPSLCTLRLARRLLRGLRSKGLASLVDFYGIQHRGHHRALADAEATAEVLLRFLDQVELEYGVEELSDLLTFQHRRYSALNHVSKHVARIRDDLLDRLPERPGVYFMQDARGKTLYVGKAQDLKSRVRSYFTSIEGHSPRIRKMVRAVRDIDWSVTASDLDALLLESRLIKDLQPAYNRAQRRYVNRPFIRIDVDHEVPRVATSAFLHDDGAEYYGPMASRSEAQFVVDLIDRFFKLRECSDATFEKGQRCVYASMDRCLAPCESISDTYAAELDRVRAFLLGRDAHVLEQIEDAMRAASSEMDYEQAKTFRDWRRRLERMLSKREAVASRVLKHNAVVVYTPDGRPPRFLVVSRGRHVATLDGREEADRLHPILERHFVEGGEALDVYREQEVDELHLLSHWMFVHRNEIRQIHWETGMPIADVISQAASVLAQAPAPAPA